MTQLFITTDIDMVGAVEGLEMFEKRDLVQIICESLSKSGEIEEIRKIVNNPLFDD